MNSAGTTAEGAAAVRRASAVVVAVLCLLLAAKTADAVSSGPGRVPFVVALFVLPLLYVVPATRHWWTARTWWLLVAQAVLTYVPFAMFGNGWVAGMSGLLAGLVLLTVAAPASWLLFGALTAAEGVLWTAVGGWPYVHLVASGTVYVLIAHVDNAFVLFGLARLADMVAKVHAARGELAGLAVSRERLQVAASLRSAVGERLASVAALAGGALPAMARSHVLARERIAQAGVVARQALADVRGMTAGYRGRPEEPAGPGTGTVLAPRLARTVLVVVLFGFAAESVNLALAADVRPVVTAMAVVDDLAIVALQLRHSPALREGGLPRAWPWTLALQAVLTYVMLPFLGFRALPLAGFLAGSLLLLLPGRWAWAAFTAVVVSSGAADALDPVPGTFLQQISGTAYAVALLAAAGLMVFGLSRLAALAVQLEALRGELARAAVEQERVQVARDTHDLLGLGLSAAALKTDLIGRLIGRDDAAARAEIGELRRICAAASSDIRLVTGEDRRLSLAGEVAAAREILLSASIDLCADMAGGPVPAAADAVMAPVLREAITNILRHSNATSCTIETAVGDGVLRLRVSNDGTAGPPAGDGGSGHGLANLAARVEAADGCLTSRQAGGRFDIIAEIPLPVHHHDGEGEPVGEVPSPGPPGG
jgi:two-component system sensor histidine kinase DesK